MFSDDMKGLLNKIRKLDEYKRISEPIFDSKIDHFPLNRAYLCSDCETVTNSPNQCPSCTSENLYPIIKFLNRK